MKLLRLWLAIKHVLQAMLPAELLLMIGIFILLFSTAILALLMYLKNM